MKSPLVNKQHAVTDLLNKLLQALMGGKLLAVGDEEGIITIMNTARPMPDILSREKATAQWLGHQNAIFGLHWYQVRFYHLVFPSKKPQSL